MQVPRNALSNAGDYYSSDEEAEVCLCMMPCTAGLVVAWKQDPKLPMATLTRCEHMFMRQRNALITVCAARRRRSSAGCSSPTLWHLPLSPAASPCWWPV